MDLSLTDVAVFAYINGLTNSKELGGKGWHGSKRRLAKVLHVSSSTMNDIVNRLEEKGYVRIHNDFITSTIHRELPAEKPAEKPAEIPVVQNSDTLPDEKPSDVPF